MRYYVLYNGEVLGTALIGHTVSDDYILKLCDIPVARTQEDYEGMPENGMYDISDLMIMDEKEYSDFSGLTILNLEFSKRSMENLDFARSYFLNNLGIDCDHSSLIERILELYRFHLEELGF